MEVNWRTSTWKQFGAAIDMLDDAIDFCPDHLWTTVVWKDPEDVRYGQYDIPGLDWIASARDKIY